MKNSKLFLISIMAFISASLSSWANEGDGIATFGYDDAPFIGGIIQHRHENKSIRLVCVEFEQQECVTFQFVSIVDGKRELFNLKYFSVSKIAELRSAIIKELSFQGNWILPTTANFMVCGVPILLPVTLPVDIALLPVTFPVAYAKKIRAANAVKALLALNNVHDVVVRGVNYKIIEDSIQYAIFTLAGP